MHFIPLMACEYTLQIQAGRVEMINERTPRAELVISLHVGNHTVIC